MKLPFYIDDIGILREKDGRGCVSATRAEKILWARVKELEDGIRSVRATTRTAVAKRRADPYVSFIEENLTLLLGDEPLDDEDEDLGPMKPWKEKP